MVATMSAEILCSNIRRISHWASENATWTGSFRKSRITLSPIHPLHSISNLTLKLGRDAIPLEPPSHELIVNHAPCGCCFEFCSPDNSRAWCRFEGCQKSVMSNVPVQYLFTKVIRPQYAAIDTIVHYKITKGIATQDLERSTVTNQWLIETNTEKTLVIPKHIEKLNIRHCPNLSTLAGITKDSALHTLHLEWCPNLVEMVEINAFNLKELYIHWCANIAVLPNLHGPNLERLSIQACQQLKSLPTLEHCPNLEGIQFCWFSHPIAVPTLKPCKKLRFMTLRAMKHMSALPEHHINFLEAIDVAESESLTTINVVGQRLRTLIADGCTALETVDVTNSPNLQNLSLARVSKLQRIRGLVENHSLQSVQISQAPTLSHLDGLETNFELRELTLVNCVELTHLPKWRRLIQLRELTIYGCKKLESLPSWTLPSLETLRIGGCDAMTELVTLKQFPNLKFFKWASFKGQESTIDVSALIYLEELTVTGHPTLRSINGLDKIQRLRHVDFSRCRTLKRISSLENSTGLRSINIQGCRSFLQLPPLFQLEYLEELQLSHCHNLRRLDCLYYHPHLKLLNISHCPSLERLPLLHRGTRESLRQIFCSDLPQPIDLSKLLGGTLHPQLEAIHLEGSNIITLTPLLKCGNLKEVTGLEPTDQWMLMLSIAIRRRDKEWIEQHWKECLQQLNTTNTEQMATTCIDAVHLMHNASMTQALFEKFRSIEHASSGDSLISAPIWEKFFLWLHSKNLLHNLFAPLLTTTTLKIDLMREENWFPVLIDVCRKKSLSKKDALLLEEIYQVSLFKNTPMYNHLRSKWSWLIEKS